MFYASLWQEHAAEAPSIIAYLYERKAALKSNIGSGIATSAKAREGLYESSFDLLAAPHAGIAKLKAFSKKPCDWPFYMSTADRPISPAFVR